MMKPRADRFTPEEMAAVSSCFAGTCKGMTFDTTSRLITVSAGGHGGDPKATDGPTKKETLPSVPVVFPYGFLSLAPAGPRVELHFLESASGLICVSSRYEFPSGLPTPEAGDSMVFASSGAYAHIPASGNTVIEPNASTTVKVGAGATDFVALSTPADTALAAIFTAFNEHIHPIVSIGCSVDPVSHIGTASGFTDHVAPGAQLEDPETTACEKLKAE